MEYKDENVNYKVTKEIYNMFKDRMVHEIFEEQVKKNPNKIALCYKDKILTYKEVNCRANQLAHYLVSVGVKSDDAVAVMLDRSFELVISILAILKAGAAYLPVDPQYPESRIKYYLSNSKVTVMITSEKFKMKCNKNITCIFLDDDRLLEDHSKNNLIKRATMDNLAYVIYTSGSTGRPKGVMIENKSLINRIFWMISNFKLSEKDIFLQKTSPSFDVSVWELLCWCTIGAKLVILEDSKEKIPRFIVNIIEIYKVTVIHFVPSVLELFLEYIESKPKFDINTLKSLKYIISSGEELSRVTVKRFNNISNKRLSIELWNLYGPTEATIDITSFNCKFYDENSDRVPIGKPIFNTQMYIFDENMNEKSIGEVGELHVGGLQLARGYQNNEELTKEKFIINPLNNNIIYKTGDLAMYNSSGYIEYRGRIDSQVKLRGLRIELGEIENTILKYKNIIKVVVLLDERNRENKMLVAFYTCNGEIIGNDLKEFLKSSLPQYMIPERFQKVDRFTTTINGKVDKKKLIDTLGK